MKILILIDVYSKSPMGGAGTVLLETAKAFRAAGHEVLVLCRRRDDLGEYEYVEGVPFWTFSADGAGVGGPLALLRAYRRVCREGLAGRRWDLVLSHHPLPLWAVSGAIPRRIPLVSIFHSPWPEEYRLMQGAAASALGLRARTWIENEAMDCSDRVVTLSRYMQGEVRARYAHCAERVEVVPGGVDARRFPYCADPRTVRDALGVPFSASSFWVLTVRRHVPRTGIAMLIDAVSRIRDEAPELRLVIGGGGPLLEEHRRRVADAGLGERIHLTGFVAADRLASLYQAADLFVMPSAQLEGFGLSTLEAMACGTPVLGTPVGGIPEILGPYQGDLLAKGADEGSVAHALLTWYTRRDRLRELRPTARAYAAGRYSWDLMRQGLERVFQRLVAADEAGSPGAGAA